MSYFNGKRIDEPDEYDYKILRDDKEEWYYREDVNRFVNVACTPQMKPSLCIHNNRIDEPCGECQSLSQAKDGVK